MSELAVWLTDTTAGRGIVRVWAPARHAALLAADGVVVEGEHPERPWCVVVELSDSVTTSCTPGA